MSWARCPPVRPLCERSCLDAGSSGGSVRQLPKFARSASHMKRRMPSRITLVALQRTLMLLVAFGCSVLQLESAVHFVLVHHSVCQEHGELVHGESGHDLGQAVPPVAAAAGEGDHASVSVEPTAAADSHDHDHCLGAAARHASSAAPRLALRLAVAPRRAMVTAVASRGEAPAPLPRQWLLLLAPKNSPPSGAVGHFHARRAS